ncbi:N-formylglutamate deformylase [Jannaschia seosinensis]|uniref:N-formylglutamate deformylase n=1 Tax=Jannaschia seosinensis TaxID=313367 RepID=A0A0M7B824_9RHOB|nr:N-formylglutamate amidohydrolase [Jannaschia seosinensis]CUH09578.1 N-formylglutamate deformylase [Jannaschia seosinensis]
MSKPTHELFRPHVTTTPVVVASPHSGRDYDWEFATAPSLDAARLRSSEDAYMDRLLTDIPSLGAPLLVARVPRALLDLNRAAEELDPAVIQDVPRGATNPRISSGLGVIPRVVAQGRAIYDGKISRGEAQARIDRVWQPYHETLRGLMDEAHACFGRALLLDFHSMPHEAIEGAGPAGQTPEVVLGDRFGASASGEMVDVLEAILGDLGLRVVRNAPFAGAYVTQFYGKPARGRHAIQIEIDRALYLDEARIERNARFDEVRDLLTEAVARFCDAVGGAEALAAE